MSAEHSNATATLILPAYNEASRVGSDFAGVIGSYKSALEREYGDDHALVVVSDGSTDETALVARDCGAIVLEYEDNRGRGGALKLGFMAMSGAMTEADKKVITYTDADGAYSPDHILRLHDAVLGSESEAPIAVSYRLDGLGGFMRRVGHSSLHRVCERLAPTGVRDPQAGAKAFRGDVAEELWSEVDSQGWSADKQVLYLARRKSLAVVELGAEVNNAGDSRVDFIRDPGRMVKDSWHIGRSKKTAV